MAVLSKKVKFLTNSAMNGISNTPNQLQPTLLVERHIQTVKMTLKKAHYDKKYIYLVLLELNNTQIDNMLGSPNQIIQGKNVRGVMSKIPS